MNEIKIHGTEFIGNKDYTHAIEQGNSCEVLGQMIDSMLQKAHIDTDVEFDAAIQQLDDKLKPVVSHLMDDELKSVIPHLKSIISVVEVKYMNRYYFNIIIFNKRFLITIIEQL